MKAEEDEKKWQGKVDRAEKELRRQVRKWKKTRGEDYPVFLKKQVPDLSSYLEDNGENNENLNKNNSESLGVGQNLQIKKVQNHMNIIREEQINRTLKSILW